MIEIVVYLVAPLAGIFMDKMYYGSIKNIIFGYFDVKKKYSYDDFVNIRIIGIIIASLLIANSAVNKNIFIAMAGAALFSLSHLLIYLDIYLRERGNRIS